MRIIDGHFPNPERHHKGWFKVFRFERSVEVWFGEYWINIDWSKR